MRCDSSSASAVTDSTPSPGSRRRFPANNMIRVQLSAGLKETVGTTAKGSRLLVTESIAMARVESAWLNSTGRLDCAADFGYQNAFSNRIELRVSNTNQLRTRLRVI